MKCPYCGDEESKVIDSRPTEDGERIRRRRECLSCGKRERSAEALALSGCKCHSCQQVAKQYEVYCFPAVIICRCPV